VAGAGWPPSLLALANRRELRANSSAGSTATSSAPKQHRERLNAV